MSMMFCISGDELRKALAEIEAAEANGFMHCLAVFEMRSAGYMLDDNLARYSDLLERAHPTDGHLNWGRHQRVTKRHRFEDGALVAIEAEPK